MLQRREVTRKCRSGRKAGQRKSPLDFGNFWLRNTAEGTDIAEAAHVGQITGILPRFIPGKEFKKALDAIEFGKV